jgi:hypothetical protein
MPSNPTVRGCLHIVKVLLLITIFNWQNSELDEEGKKQLTFCAFIIYQVLH